MTIALRENTSPDPTPARTLSIASHNPQRETAAALVAYGDLDDSGICQQIGISRQTLSEWKNSPEFTERVQEHLEEFRAAVTRRGVALLERRLDALNERWLALKKIIEQRAGDLGLASVPGGTTGLLVKRTKGIGAGERFQLVDEYVVDTALLKELREHEKQAAQELGQWTEVAGSDQAVKEYVTLGPDEI